MRADPRFLPLLLLVLAGLLRFTGIGRGLRHQPDQDEQPFVENAAGMITRGDLDHRYYEYPGLLFVLLVPPVALAGAAPPGPAAYLASRCVVAGFGVLSVLLVHLLARRLGGTWAGVAAAALLAVSPLEVENAHEVKPDVVLESFALATLLALLGVGSSLRRDACAGLAMGAATAVKFSGVLLLPVYAARRLLVPGPRWRGIVIAAGAAALAYAAGSPYSLLHPSEQLEGAVFQATYHYPQPQSLGGWAEMAWLYLKVIALRGLGLPGAALAVASIFAARRAWRDWLPLLALPLTIVAVFATAPIKHDRFMLAGLGATAVLAGLAVAALAARAPRAAAAVVLVATLVPLADTLRYLRDITRPDTRDQALDWIEAHVPPGTRLLNGVPTLGLDRHRYEVLEASGSGRLDALLSRAADVVVLSNGGSADFAAGLPLLFRAEASGPWSARPVSILTVPEGSRPWQLVPLVRADLTASENADLLGDLLDGRPETGWLTKDAQRPGDWLQVTFPRPERIGRIDLDLGTRPLRFGRRLEVRVPSADAWTAVPWISGRIPVEEQAGREGWPSQVLLLVDAPRAAAVRIVQTDRADRRWGAAELRAYAVGGP